MTPQDCGHVIIPSLPNQANVQVSQCNRHLSGCATTYLTPVRIKSDIPKPVDSILNTPVPPLLT